MSSLFDIEPYVSSEIPGVSRPMMALHLRKAARYFCCKTLLAERTETFSVASGENSVTLAALTDYDFVRIMQGRWDDNRPMLLASSDQLDLENPTFQWHGGFENNVIADKGISNDWRQESGTPCALFSDYAGALTIAPTADAAGTLVVKFAVQPGINSTELDDGIVNSFYEVIGEGAVASLQKVPKKEWTDKPVGAAGWMAFTEKVESIRSDRIKGFKRDDWSVSRVRSHY